MFEFSFRFDGSCRTHPTYNPREHGRPTDDNCAGCESLYVVYLFTRIAARKARGGEGIEARFTMSPESMERPDNRLGADSEEPAQGLLIPESE